MRSVTPSNIRVTRIGLVYILLALVVGLAATNTGNNALYLIWSAMLGLLVVSGVISRSNVRALGLGLEPPGEIHAETPFRLQFVVRSRARWFARRLLVLRLGDGRAAALVPLLPPGGVSRGAVELELATRGRHRLRWAHVTSLFPLGLFTKGMRHRLDLELLVFPRLLQGRPPRVAAAGRVGEEASHRPGRGHELLALREFRVGDDPRQLHWKQSARTGRWIVTEREAEVGRRLSVALDNGVLASSGDGLDPERAELFEERVREAATAACHYLERGYDLELVTRDGVVPFGSGRRQRWSILEHLALVAPTSRSPRSLVGRDARVPRLVFELDRSAPAVRARRGLA